MAKKRDLEVSISPTGEVQVHVSGMPGKACLKIKELLERELNAQPLSQRNTSEYYQNEEEARLNLERRLG